MKYGDMAAACMLLVMIITTVSAWMLHWVAGVSMLCAWLLVCGMAARSLEKEQNP